MTQSRFARTLPLAAGLLIVLSGCAATQTVREVERSGQAVSFERYQAARSPSQENRSFVVSDGFYAARRPISVTPINPAMVLPPVFSQPANMDIQMPTSITEIGSRITKMSGYRVAVDQDVLAGRDSRSSRGSRGSSSAQAAAAPPMTLPPMDGGPLPDAATPPGVLPPLPVSMEMSMAPDDTILSDVVYRGNLSGLLDEVTGRLNLSWRWTGSQIEIFRYETKMFRLNALASKTSTSSNLNTTSSTSKGSGSGGGGVGGSGDSGNTGSSGSNISVSNEMDVWEEVRDNIEALLSSDGKLSISPTAGLITVRDTPSVLFQIEKQLDEYNRIYSKQVMLHVEVYAVERSQGDDYSLNWDAVWKRASNALGFSYQGAGGTSAGPAFTIEVTDENSPFFGSNVVGRALSTIGNTTLLTSGTVITLNGKTVPLNVSREQAYLQSSSTSISGEHSMSSTTLTPGVATEGFAMNFTPKILDSNQVLLHYSIDLSVIEDIETFTAPGGGTAIQLPRRSVRNFLQEVSVRSGRSLVLTGFQQAQGVNGGSGPFSPSAWFLGGGKQTEASSRTIVIVVTPYVTQQ